MSSENVQCNSIHKIFPLWSAFNLHAHTRTVAAHWLLSLRLWFAFIFVDLIISVNVWSEAKVLLLITFIKLCYICAYFTFLVSSHVPEVNLGAIEIILWCCVAYVVLFDEIFLLNLFKSVDGKLSLGWYLLKMLTILIKKIK